MVTLKKFTQYLIAVGMAFLVFSATLVSENAVFFLFSNNTDPLEKAIQFDTEIRIDTEQKGSEHLSQDGEFIIVFPGTVIDFERDRREIVNGSVFYSSLFLHPDIQKDVPLPNFTDPLRAGHFKVRKLLIHAPQSSIFVVRDNGFKTTHVFVWGHQATLLWEGGIVPFVVPANTKLSVPDSFFETPTLSYQETKDILGYTPFPPSLEGSTLTLPEEMLSISLERLKIQQKEMDDFAFFLPQLWDQMGERDHFMKKIIDVIKSAQKKLSIAGVREQKGKESFFLSLHSFVKANSLIRNGKTSLGKLHLTKFNAILESVAWKMVLEKNPNLDMEWNHFFIAHNAWMQNGFSEDTKQFLKIWKSLEKTTPLKSIQDHFFQLEKYITRDLIRGAKKEIEEMQKIIDTHEITSGMTPEITQIRRMLGEFMQREILLQNEETFTLFASLIKKEIALTQDEHLLNEIKIEGIRFSLSFLKIFLEDQNKIETSRVLLQLYEELSRGNFLEHNGKNILTVEEKDLISFLVLVGNTGLSPEEIALIKEKHEIQKELGERIDEVKEQQSSEDVNKNSGQLQNAKYLNALFEKIGVPTETVYFSTNRAEGITSFRDGEWKGFLLSGTFHYPTQFFQTLKVGDTVENNFHARFLSGVLLQIEEKRKQEEIKENEIVFVSQTTPQAILERKLLQELLSLHSFVVERENIILLDAEMSYFKVSNARFNERYFVEFFYNRDLKTLESLQLQTKKNPVIFDKRVFKLETVKQELSVEIDKLKKGSLFR
jgi:hypothetical protein